MACSTSERICGPVDLPAHKTASRELGTCDMAFEDHIVSPGPRALINQVETLVAAVDSKNTRELFQSFARVDRFAAG